jgi:hypothetical protein
LLGIPVVDVDVDGEDADDIHTPMQSGKNLMCGPTSMR